MELSDIFPALLDVASTSSSNPDDPQAGNWYLEPGRILLANGNILDAFNATEVARGSPEWERLLQLYEGTQHFQLDRGLQNAIGKARGYLTPGIIEPLAQSDEAKLVAVPPGETAARWFETGPSTGSKWKGLVTLAAIVAVILYSTRGK